MASRRPIVDVQKGGSRDDRGIGFIVHHHDTAIPDVPLHIGVAEPDIPVHVTVPVRPLGVHHQEAAPVVGVFSTRIDVVVVADDRHPVSGGVNVVGVNDIDRIWSVGCSCLSTPETRVSSGR